ncbi:MAG: carbonate dehydratase [Desulfobulbaceae bacterium]
MSELNHLLANNRAWAAGIKKDDPEFFEKLFKQQAPEYLWIGCADSRVPANQIVGMLPGELFVHRNVANMVIHSDLNCLSVIQFAVEVLAVKHIIVCGHYGCGGVKAAMETKDLGLIDNWLGHIRDVYRYHWQEFYALHDEEERFDRLCELNVIEQVGNVCATTFVKNAWRAGRQLSVHGWIYSIRDGILKDFGVCITGQEQISSFFKE